MRATSFFKFLALCSSLVVGQLAAVTYLDATGGCTSYANQGMAIFCYTGACYDGSSNYQTGICADVGNACLDFTVTPSCAANQVYNLTGSYTINANTESCWVDEYWHSIVYEWDCCNCPANSIPELEPQGKDASDCIAAITTGFQCVKCQDPAATIQYNAARSDYLCVNPTIEQALCKYAKDASSTITQVSLMSSLVGTFCPQSLNAAGAVGAIASNILNYYNWYTSPGTETGLNKPGVSAALGTISAISGWLIGVAAVVLLPEEIAVAGAIYETYQIGCTVNTYLTNFLTLEGTYVDACTPAIARRSLNQPEAFTVPVLYKSLSKRNNPCMEFLSNFPSNFANVSTAFRADCEVVSVYNLANIADLSTQGAIRNLQTLCANNKASLAALADFGAMLAAIQNSVPYCDVLPEYYDYLTSVSSSTTSASLIKYANSTITSTTSSISSTSSLHLSSTTLFFATGATSLLTTSSSVIALPAVSPAVIVTALTTIYTTLCPVTTTFVSGTSTVISVYTITSTITSCKGSCSSPSPMLSVAPTVQKAEFTIFTSICPITTTFISAELTVTLVYTTTYTITSCLGGCISNSAQISASSTLLFGASTPTSIIAITPASTSSTAITTGAVKFTGAATMLKTHRGVMLGAGVGGLLGWIAL